MYPIGTAAFEHHPEDSRTLYYIYSTTDVEHREEAYIYNFSTIVSSVGGSVSLFLGLSFLDVFRLYDLFFPCRWRSSREGKNRLGKTPSTQSTALSTGVKMPV